MLHKVAEELADLYVCDGSGRLRVSSCVWHRGMGGWPVLARPCHSLPFSQGQGHRLFFACDQWLRSACSNAQLRFAMWLMSWPIYMNVLAVANFPYPAVFHSAVQEAGQCSYTHVISQCSSQCSCIQKYREGVPKTPRGLCPTFLNAWGKLRCRLSKCGEGVPHPPKEPLPYVACCLRRLNLGKR